MRGFKEFEFDLPAALLGSLVNVFKKMDRAPLVEAAVRAIPNEQGVYLLHHKGVVAYVGKTDGEAGLQSRLLRHCESVQHRQGLDPVEVEFQAIRIYVFTVVDLETQLIKEFKGAAWNKSGFGSNDPGRERDTTRLKEDGFDAQFPINIDCELDLELPAGDLSASQVLEALRLHLPYTFRFERAAPELKALPVVIPSSAKTARSIISQVFTVLPAGWQAWALPGRIIMYREARDYLSGALIDRS